MRTGLFKETLLETIERNCLRWVWAIKHYNIALLPFALMWLREHVAPQRALPNSTKTRVDGECAGLVRDLADQTLVKAYKRGLYTSDHYGAMTWSSPPERCVLFFDDIQINKNVRRLMKQKRYSVTFDRAFEQVIKACAGRRAGKWHTTWITPRIMRAYAALYDAGSCIRSRCGTRKASSSAAATASRSAACSSPSRNSRTRATHRRSASRCSMASCAMGLSAQRRQEAHGRAGRSRLPHNPARGIPRASCGRREQAAARPAAGRWNSTPRRPPNGSPARRRRRKLTRSHCSPLSSPAQAGDPAVRRACCELCASLTAGCPAFAGHDSCGGR